MPGLRRGRVREALRFNQKPTGNYATLRFTADKAQEVSVQVTDVLSRVVARVTKSATVGPNRIELPTADLKAGTYLVTL